MLYSFSGSHASNNPMLNFIVYIPSRDQHPLQIKHKNGTKPPQSLFYKIFKISNKLLEVKFCTLNNFMVKTSMPVNP